MEKMYGIEKMEGYRVCEYRFYSLYNGTRGTWRSTKKDAIKDGEAHQRIIQTLYGMGKESETNCRETNQIISRGKP